MPIFTDPQNEKRALRWLIIFFIFGSVFCLWFFFIKGGKFKDGGVEYSEREISEKKEQVESSKEYLIKIEDSISAIDISSLSLDDQNSIAKLKYLRELDVLKANSLIDSLNRFDEWPDGNQRSLMMSVAKYIADKANPEKHVDYMSIANSILNKANDQANDDQYKRSMDSLMLIIAQGQNKYDSVMRLIGPLRAAQLQYQKQKNEVAEMLNQLAEYKKDSVANASRIADLNVKIANKNDSISKLKNEIHTYNPISVRNCSFTAPGAKNPRDGLYYSKKMKTISLTFTPYTNTSTKNGKVKVVFSGALSQQVFIVDVTMGQPQTVKFPADGGTYDFQPGEYYAQILSVPSDSILDLETITVKDGFFK